MLHECIINLNKDLKKIEHYYDDARLGKEFNFVIDIQPFTEAVDRNISELNDHKEQVLQLPLMNEKN